MLVDQLVDLDMDTGQKVVNLSFNHSCFLGNGNINRVAPWVVVGKMCRMTRGGFWVTSRWRPWVERWLPAAVSATPTIPPQKTAAPPVQGSPLALKNIFVFFPEGSTFSWTEWQLNLLIYFYCRSWFFGTLDTSMQCALCSLVKPKFAKAGHLT